MKCLLAIALLFVWVHESYCATCTACTTTFEATSKACNDIKDYLTCLETASPTCHLAAGKATALKGFYDTVTKAACPLTSTCECQYTYWITDLSGGDVTAICTADTAYLMCLKGKTELSCSGANPWDIATTHRANVATACSGAFTDTCACEMTLAGSDLSAKCVSYTTFLTCIKGKTAAACLGGTAADLRKAGVLALDGISGCATDTCQCQIDFHKATPSCNTDKAFYNCLKGKTLLACDGTPAHTLAQAFNPSQCSIDATSACFCEKTYAETDVTDATKKCAADKAFFVCMKGKTGPTCLNADARNAVVNHNYVTTCPTSTCKCVIEYLKADKTGNAKCTADKAYITCMKGKTEASCDSTTASAEATAYPVIDATCIPVGSACECDNAYARADIVADKCSADKTFLVCLKGKTTMACDGRAANVVASTHTVEAACSNAFTDTCKCEVNLAKMDMSSDANKCGSYKTFLSCMKTATGVSCVNAATAVSVVTTADDALKLITSANCQISATCACEIAYARNDISLENNKCSANKALIKCLRNKTASGCVDSTTVATLVVMAETPVPNCALTSVCKCESNYVKGEKTAPEGHCSNAKTLLACLYNETVAQCDGGSKADLQSLSIGLIKSEITGCTMDDTCTCEELMVDGTCGALKNGIACLRTASSTGCNGVKTAHMVADEADTKVTALASCTLDSSCKCELNYTQADATTDAKRCTSAKTLKTCLEKAKTDANGAALKGCDGSTLVTTIISDMSTITSSKTCGAMKNCVFSLILFVMALLADRLAKQ